MKTVDIITLRSLMGIAINNLTAIDEANRAGLDNVAAAMEAKFTESLRIINEVSTDATGDGQSKERNVGKALNKDKTCIAILEAIHLYQTYLDSDKDSISKLPHVYSMFPELKTKHLHQCDIYKRCIARLWERYDRASRR